MENFNIIVACYTIFKKKGILGYFYVFPHSSELLVGSDWIVLNEVTRAWTDSFCGLFSIIVQRLKHLISTLFCAWMNQGKVDRKNSATCTHNVTSFSHGGKSTYNKILMSSLNVREYNPLCTSDVYIELLWRKSYLASGL